MTDFPQIRALTFDVFGTVVDWRGGIAREAENLLAPKGIARDWGAFAAAWRSQYQPAMAEVREGRRGYVVMDQLHREMLESALEAFDIAGLSEPEKHTLTMGWRRLDPWADVIDGMACLKANFALAALSNGNIALVLAMAKRAGIPWDTILGSQLVGTYKPDAAIYDSAPRFLDLAPQQIMMVACHPWDLDSAKSRGLRTAYIHRPLEWGPGTERPLPEPGTYDVIVHSLTELADALGA